jgi:hypothetical protein
MNKMQGAYSGLRLLFSEDSNTFEGSGGISTSTFDGERLWVAMMRFTAIEVSLMFLEFVA